MEALRGRPVRCVAIMMSETGRPGGDPWNGLSGQRNGPAPSGGVQVDNRGIRMYNGVSRGSSRQSKPSGRVDARLNRVEKIEEE